MEFLVVQATMSVLGRGDFVEVGIETSSILGAFYLLPFYLLPDETIVLVNINETIDAKQMLKSLENS